MAWEMEGLTVNRMVKNVLGKKEEPEEKKKKKANKKKRLVEVPKIEIDHTKEQSELDKLKKKIF